MNKLLTPLGGMPFEGDDLQWIQSGIAEAIKGALSRFADSDGNLIISGLEITDSGSQLEFTEGFILLNHEIMYFPALTIAVADGTDDVYLVEDITYDANGLDNFADLSVKNTYEIRRGKAVHSPGITYPFSLVSAKRLDAVLKDIVTSIYQENSIGNLLQGFPFFGGWGAASGSYAKVIKDGKLIRLQGRITGGSLDGSTAFSIASTHRPSIEVSGLVHTTVGTNSAVIVVQTNGDVLFLQTGTPVVSGSDYVDISFSFWMD